MAGRGLEGFSPEIRALLERAGVNLEVGGGFQQGVSSPVWGRNLAPTRQEEAASPWYRLGKATGVTPNGWIGDQQNPAVQAAVARGPALDPETRKLLDQVEKARGQEAARGAPDQRHGPSVLSRLLNYIGRPGQAAEGFLLRGGGEAIFNPAQTVRAGKNPFHEVARGGRATVAGFTGKERIVGSEELDRRGIAQGDGAAARITRAVGGFGLDAALDPLSYATFGIGSAAAKGAAKGSEAVAARAAVRAGAESATASGARMSADDLVRHLTAPKSRAPITMQAIDVAAVDVGRQAATVARSSLANDLARLGMETGRAKASAVRWLNPVAKLTPAQALEKATWLARVKADPVAAGARYLDRSAAEISREAAEATSKQLTALAEANMTAALRKTVTVSAAGYRMANVPIPTAATAVAARVGQMPAAATAIRAFDRTFSTGSRFDRGLTALKARSAGLAERRIDAARTSITSAFQGVNAEQRHALQEALAASPKGFGRGLVKLADGRDGGDLLEETYDHIGRYIDWDGKGSGLVAVGDLNRFLPKRFKFDKVAPGVVGSPAEMVASLVRRNAGHLRTADPAQHLYALHIAVEKAVARDQLARGAATFGIPVSPAGANVLGPDGRMLAATSKAAKELRDKHGWAEIVTHGRDKTVSASYAKHFDGLLFDPDTRDGLEKLLAVADDVGKRGELMHLYDRSLGGLKKALTLPSPSYHLRNSFGDVFLGYLDNVSGVRGTRSYEQASRTMLALRTLGKRPGVREVLDSAVDPVTGQATNPIEVLAAAASAGRKGAGPGSRVMRTPKAWKDAPGGYLSAEQLWAAYNHTGLKRGFVKADLPDELAANPGAVRAAVGGATSRLMDWSQAREDYFRLAHFIDRIKRSKETTFENAAEEAAHYVRKFHFDYHDVTPTEQQIFARIFPFYKFQRFAAPLMVQMLFAKPGRIQNAQRALYATSDAAGYERDDMGLPTAAEILPDYMRDQMMIPLLRSAAGNNVYANPGLPGTAIPNQVLGLSGDSPGSVLKAAAGNVVGSVNPIVQAPFELATGRRVFGGGTIPTGPLPQYLAGKTPVTNLAFATGQGKEDTATRWASFFSGLGLSENTPKRQRGALMDELERIRAQRKKDAYTAPKKTRGRSDSRRDSRGG